MDLWRAGFGALALFTGWYFIRHNRSSRALLEAAERWPSTEGTILSSEVERHGGSRPTFSAHVEYRFEAGGATHTSDAVTIGGGLRGARARAEERVAQYPVGKAVTVYYDPADPSHCCLDRRHEGAWLELLGGVFGIVAGAALLVTAFG